MTWIDNDMRDGMRWYEINKNKRQRGTGVEVVLINN
jgi:hypothetical protein